GSEKRFKAEVWTTTCTPASPIVNSGWTDPTIWISTGLSFANTKYLVYVKAKSHSEVETLAVSATAYTSIETPEGIEWIYVGVSSISLRPSNDFTNFGSGQTSLYFSTMAGSGSGAGETGDRFDMWFAGIDRTDAGLTENTSYTYRIKARNYEGDETDWPVSVELTTCTRIHTPLDTDLWIDIPESSSTYIVIKTSQPVNESIGFTGVMVEDTITGKVHITTGVYDIKDESLLENTSHSYKIKYKNIYGVMTDSNPTSVTMWTKCNPPVKWDYSNIQKEMITFLVHYFLNDNIGASAYRFNYNDSASTSTNTGGFEAGANFFGRGQLTPNTKHTLKAWYKNGGGIETNCISTTVYTLANVPGKPTVTNPLPSSLKLTLNPNGNSNITEYAIYCSIYDNFITSNSVKTDGTLAPGYEIYWATYTAFGGGSGIVVGGLNSSTTYYFKVIARNGDGILATESGGVWSEVGYERTSNEDIPPGKITDLVAHKGIQHREIYLTWTAPGDDGYTNNIGEEGNGAFEIKYSSMYDFSSSTHSILISTVCSVGVGQYWTITGLEPLTTYYFLVRTRDEVPDQWSVWSDTANAVAELDVESAGVDYLWPPDGTVGIAVSTQVVIRFSENMDVTTISSETIKIEAVRDNMSVSTSSIVSTAVTYSNKYAIITLNGLEHNYTYRVTVTTGIKDLGGNSVKATNFCKLVWVFTTIMNIGVPNKFVVIADTTTNEPLVEVVLTENALPENYYIDCSTDPITSPLEIDPSIIDRAVDKESKYNADTHKFVVVNSLRELNAYNIKNEKLSATFGNKVTISIPYKDRDNLNDPDDRFVANLSKSGTDLRTANSNAVNVKEKTLRMYYLYEKDNLWVRIPNSEVHPENNTVTATVNHFSVFAIIGQSDYNLSDAYAYPVPYEPNKYSEHKNSGITFTDLSDKCTIKIYTITGELVKTIEHDSDIFEGYTEIWNPVVNENNEELASEVYIYRISNNEQSKTGKLIIIK
ncbi:MAG: hypothetical protein COY53_00640, partial [Elusimicrobia bacterium CG_4_10_14_0_8_um_filter_37_32]